MPISTNARFVRIPEIYRAQLKLFTCIIDFECCMKTDTGRIGSDTLSTGENLKHRLSILEQTYRDNAEITPRVLLPDLKA